jgi:hypothetical protein
LLSPLPPLSETPTPPRLLPVPLPSHLQRTRSNGSRSTVDGWTRRRR